jgi:energy-coupling factor transporter ATP-binding protein EcfA2
MRIDLTITNYRCFSTATPAHLTLTQGFSAFVGINNAGKSSLLKFFYELRPLFRQLSTTNGLQSLYLNGEMEIEKVPEVPDLEGLFCNSNQDDMKVEIELAELPEDQSRTRVTGAVLRGDRKTKRWNVALHTPLRQVLPGDERANLRWSGFEFIADNRHVAYFQEFSDACKLLSSSYYVPSFRHITAFNPAEGGPSVHYDVNVGRPFIEMWHILQAGDSSSDRRRLHRLVEEIKDIFAFRELQISPSVNRNGLQLIIDGQPFNLQELGSGLAQFILVLGNAAFRDPSFILIDKPELNLHPTLQVKLLMKLGNYASQGVLFATHNIGLARSVSDEIYSVDRTDAGTQVSEINHTPRLAELLGELNYEGYRPLGFKKLLLVEGRTSFKVFVELLRILNKDHEFLVATMSDLINQNSKEELQEVTRVCPHVFAVIDSERRAAGATIEAGRKAFTDNCARLGISCHVLERRAIENYLPDRAIKKAMGPTYRALNPYEGRQGLRLWPKKDNWKIAHRMERADIEATDLGKFLLRI